MPRITALLVRPVTATLAGVALCASSACTYVYSRVDDTGSLPRADFVRLGITGLVTDSIGLIKGKKIGLVTNQAAVDEKGHTDISVLTSLTGKLADANVRVVAIFAPEHGLTAMQDTRIASTMEAGIPVYSLYGAETVPPPDSAMANLDVLVIDLPDVGSRTWTYEGAMVYALRAAARAKKPVIVLDRPNPITGSVVEGPVLDSAIANADDPIAGKPGLAYALAPIPLRHGMTMAELARYYNDALNIHATLSVVPARGWHREVWYDLTKLPFVQPSPNLPTFRSVMLYPGLVPFEATNLSVGRGSDLPFQRIGAPWLNAAAVIQALKTQVVNGVRFYNEPFRPLSPTDGKYNDTTVQGIRIEVTDRSALQTSRLTASLLSAIHKVHGEQLRVDSVRFDRLFGSAKARVAIMKGDNPDTVIDQEYGPAYAFRERVKRYLLY